MQNLTLIQDFLQERGLSLSSPEARELVTAEIPADAAELEEIFGHGPLAGLLNDPTVTEILVNGGQEIWAERDGGLALTNLRFFDEESLRRWCRRILSERGRKVDHSSPFADCSLADGSRVHVVAPAVSRKGLCLSIRKFPRDPWSLAQLAERGAIRPTHLEYLREAVRSKRNIFLSGGTGSGKTSLLGALIGEVNASERIVALEDIAEIRVNHPHFISLEGRPANQEGEGSLNISRLLKESLRMRPDRLIVGECRGAEALDLLLALNTGHRGSMGTIHANSPRDALQRLETLALLAGDNVGDQALRNLIVGGIHVIAQLEKIDGKRCVSALAEIKGVDGGRFLLKEII